jgi:hypothetical protein
LQSIAKVKEQNVSYAHTDEMRRPLTEVEKRTLRQNGLSHVVDREENLTKPGELKMLTRHDQTGRPIFEFIGDKSVWMNLLRKRNEMLAAMRVK